ncbi:MAG TPA: ABC transporter [Porphyromonadaceae bacterium]|nr:ABC transporter [Porphyromonadaceae bacterium]
MKTIFRIAKNELYSLFYSPIAWLTLIIFSFQIYSGFTSLLNYYTDAISLGRDSFPNLTIDLFLRGAGAPFRSVASYLFLYIPLLTMSLISQEYNGETIKLLFSSPITGAQIILGKYIAMMLYGLLLICVLIVPLVVSLTLVSHLYVPMILTGLLGIYLLFCTYAAIGLFMSTLTSYQMLAALGTLTFLSILQYVGKLGQNIDFVRDISYWLSISGRVDEFLWGLICSEDFIYFVIVSLMFIGLSILRLESGRKNDTKAVNIAKYGGVIVGCLLIGYITSMPVFKIYYDATENKQRTLTPNSQEILSKIEGGLTMTAFVNLLDKNFYYGLPKSWNNDKKQFEQYIRFKPEMKLKYVLFYDSIPGSHMPESEMKKEVEKLIVVHNLNPKKILSPEQIHKIIDLRPEENRFVRLFETDKGKKVFLRMYDDMYRYPSESEISAALKTLVKKRPLVAFVTGHNERNVDLDGDINYRKFTKILTQRESLVNQGFNPISLAIGNGTIPEDVDILVIADPQSPYLPQELAAISRFIARGGNLIIAGEPRRSHIVNEILIQLGVRMMPGTLVHPTESNRSDLLFVPITSQSDSISSKMGEIAALGGKIAMPSVGGLEIIGNSGYRVTALAETQATGYWNELQTTNFSVETPSFNPPTGEIESAIPTILALSKEVGEKGQKIIIMGDADCISNAELSMNRDIRSANWSFIMNAFKWLANDEFPVNIDRPSTTDDKIKITPNLNSVISIVMKWGIPGGLLLLAIIVWLKRRRH